MLIRVGREGVGSGGDDVAGSICIYDARIEIPRALCPAKSDRLPEMYAKIPGAVAPLKERP